MSCTLLFDSRTPPIADSFGCGLIDAREASDPLSGYGRYFDFGYALGLQERDAQPPAELSELLKEAFLDGLSMGFIQAEHERREDYDTHLERLEMAAADLTGFDTYVNVIDR